MGVREARGSGLWGRGERVSSGLNKYIFLLLCLLAAIIFWQHGPLEQPVKGDPGNYIYMGQEIARGKAPYSSVVEYKTPLIGLLGALAVIIGRVFEIPDLMAIRSPRWVEEDYRLYFQKGKFKVSSKSQYEYDKKTTRIYIGDDKVD